MDDVQKTPFQSVIWDNKEYLDDGFELLKEDIKDNGYDKVVKANICALDVLKEDDDIMMVDLWLMHTGKNRNHCDIPKEVIEKAIPTFYNKFIVYLLDNTLAPNDVTEHNHDQNNTTMNIAGNILADGGYRWVKKNGKEYLVMVGAISKLYQPMLTKIINKRKGNMSISIEILIPVSDIEKAENDAKNNEGDGYIHVTNMKLRGVALLGEKILEGIEGSEMNVTKFSYDPKELFSPKKIEEYNKNYLAFSQERKEISNVSSTIKRNAKKANITANFKRKEETKNMENEVIKNDLSSERLSEYLWKELDGYKYHDGEWAGRKYYIEEVFPLSRYVVVRDNETAKFYKIPFEIEGDDLKLNMEEKKEVKNGWQEVDNSFKVEFAKDEFGKGQSIEIDKSKESLSDDAWGDVDKVSLRAKVLDSPNYKDLVKDVYALVEDGWEEKPSEKLKYPIMQIKGGKAVYNRYALSSALAYAKANDENEVVKKIEEIYKSLDIEIDNVIENKLDKDNKEIEKIKDDVDADEDDKKKEIKNSEIIDKPAEKELKDDEESDKDYWKKKYESLALEYEACKNQLGEKDEELKKYVRADEEKEMRKFLKSYNKYFEKEEYDCFLAKISTMAKCDFEKEVKDKVFESLGNGENHDDDDDWNEIDKEENKDVEKKSEEKEKEFKNSLGLPTNPFVFNGFKNKQESQSIDDVLKNLNIKK